MLLQSLITLAVVLIGAAAVCAALATVLKQTSLRAERMQAEAAYRSKAVEERL